MPQTHPAQFCHLRARTRFHVSSGPLSFGGCGWRCCGLYEAKSIKIPVDGSERQSRSAQLWGLTTKPTYFSEGVVLAVHYKMAHCHNYPTFVCFPNPYPIKGNEPSQRTRAAPKLTGHGHGESPKQSPCWTPTKVANSDQLRMAVKWRILSPHLLGM